MTTVLTEGSGGRATILSETRFNWSAAIGGAAVAVATAFFLIVLGVGFGLTLMPREPGGGFFTLGAIYFLAAQAFGFVAGGHVTGRLIGPMVDAEAKAACFGRLRAKLATQGGLAVAIGDGANDLPMLKTADISVAYHAKPVVRAGATYAIDYCGLDAILNLFE